MDEKIIIKNNRNATKKLECVFDCIKWIKNYITLNLFNHIEFNEAKLIANELNIGAITDVI